MTGPRHAPRKRGIQYPPADDVITGSPACAGDDMKREREECQSKKLRKDEFIFSSTGRTLEGEDEICIISVGVDIGSSTSHLVFSRMVLERLDSRYVVSQRETCTTRTSCSRPITTNEPSTPPRSAPSSTRVCCRQCRTRGDRHRSADADRRRHAPRAMRARSAIYSPARPARSSRSAPATVSKP